MLALPLRLPTAPYGGHMGHFLLSILALMGSTPFGNNIGKTVSTKTVTRTTGHQKDKNLATRSQKRRFRTACFVCDSTADK